MTADEHVRAGRLAERAGRSAGGRQEAPGRSQVADLPVSAAGGHGAVGAGADPAQGRRPSWTRRALPMVPDVPRGRAVRGASAREVFAGQQTPLLFGEPAEWMALLVEALAAERPGKVRGGGAAARAGVRGRRPPPGTIDGRAVRVDRRRRPASRADAGSDRQRTLLLDSVRAALEDRDREAGRPARHRLDCRPR